MIVVFIPAMLLEIFIIYFVIKVFTLNLSVEVWTSVDFFLWSVSLISPAIVAIHYGAVTAKTGKSFCEQIGKYLNFCEDVSTLQRVSKKCCLSDVRT